MSYESGDVNDNAIHPHLVTLTPSLSSPIPTSSLSLSLSLFQSAVTRTFIHLTPLSLSLCFSLSSSVLSSLLFCSVDYDKRSFLLFHPSFPFTSLIMMMK
ncbi:hypothetical protein RIF29_40959 [Crotalaria pallida]|uniref:Uncharacterized protein n=1 Tax=Crotalaria pallida TaxID=3830 RepID=A0AAN9E9J7_CROPI